MQTKTLAAYGFVWTSGSLEGQHCATSLASDTKGTCRLKRYRALASRAPNSEYTIIPFQYGKGDLVTCARMS